jgi:MFS family permease
VNSSAVETNKRAVLLAHRNFVIFLVGYTTSLLGTAMASIALTFAVLDNGGTAFDLGVVFAANVVPQVLVMLGGGVLADRLGRRPVMLITDASRTAVQATLGTVLFAGRPAIWLIAVLTALRSVGEGFFTPSLGGLKVEITPTALLTEGNAILGIANSATAIAGPALAGVLIALTSPAMVIAIDAASYGASVVALALLAVPAITRPATSAWRDLADGWHQFRLRRWLFVTTVQFALFNLFSWAPYLLLGPILARQYLGGASAWGAVMAYYAGGSILGGLAVMRWRPDRPLVVATLGTFGYAAPCLMLALRAPLVAVTGGALVAGIGSAVAMTFGSTVTQQLVPTALQARIAAIETTGAFALGSLGFMAVGPVATVVGAGRMLGFAAAYAFASSAVVLALPAVRSVTLPVGDPGGVA